MSDVKRNISGRLMDLDRHGPANQEHYDREVQALFEQRLSRGDWAKLLLMGLGGLAGAGVCGMLAITEPAGMPLRTRVALAVLALIGLSWAALAGVIVRRGSVHSAVHGAWAANMGFAFSLLATAAIGGLSLTGAGGHAGAGLVLLPIAALALATVVLVAHQVRQAELRLQRKLLEIEYRLARSTEAGGAAGRAT